MSRRSPFFFLLFALLSGCATVPLCPPCPPPTADRASSPYVPANWNELPGWADEDHASALALFRAQCPLIGKRPLWLAVCEAAEKVPAGGERAFFEREFRPWAILNPNGSREGLITGYYEPVLRGSRTPSPRYATPLFAPPDDLIVVDLAQVYPELKNFRLRGRLEGRRLVPYFSRDEWEEKKAGYLAKALVWVDDPLAAFFLEIQGSGLIVFDDGRRVRLGYADQNGHPYRSIGQWLIEQGELTPTEASLQGIRAWAQAHPQRVRELLATNPSLVFFRELPAEGSGPPGALGIPLTPQRSLAVDPRHIPLGAPVWLATTQPNDDAPLTRLMLAQDTGGAIKGPVRADFYWGTGEAAGALAGRMKQRGQMWVLLPYWHRP